MKNFREFMEREEDLKGLYHSLLDPKLVARRNRLDAMVKAAYERGDHETAERLDAELDDLEERMDGSLEGMDDANRDDDAGAEEQHVDLDWSPGEELARIYDQYKRGTLHLPDEEWREKDQSYRDDPEFQRQQRTQGWAAAPKGAYEVVPISQTKALADRLRSAVLETPGGHRYGMKHDLIKSMGDEQIIDAARDAWEWKRNLRRRMGK